jgi:8-oxo-dGTP diphosphatase
LTSDALFERLIVTTQLLFFDFDQRPFHSNIVMSYPIEPLPKRDEMQAEIVTCVMIYNAETNEVLVQNRTKKYPDWSFPGGHVEKGESFYDCAVREVKEETGLTVSNLEYCGVLHWVNEENDDRYLCFMYKTDHFSGELVKESPEGTHFWMNRDEFLALPDEKFSCVHYPKSPLFHEPGKYSEVFIPWRDGDNNWQARMK